MVRGEIWLAELPLSNNSVQTGLRPVILASNNKANTFSGVLHVVPITSKAKKPMPTHVEIGTDCGLIAPSIAMAEQSMLISKNCLVKKIGLCDYKTMSKINHAIMIQFDLIAQPTAIAI